MAGNRERAAFLTVGLAAGTLGVLASPALGAAKGIEIFINDYDGWAEATGRFETIDFETLPDGSPSEPGIDITPFFNYTDQGATFSAPIDRLLIGGNPTNGFDLFSFLAPLDPGITHIRADLVEAVDSVGFYFRGNARMEVFGTDGDVLLRTEQVFTPGIPDGFLGVVSEVPMGHVIMDEDRLASIDSFHFSPVPEPATAGLVGLGGFWLLHRRGVRSRADSGRGSGGGTRR